MASKADASGHSQSNRGCLPGGIGAGEHSPPPTAAAGQAREGRRTRLARARAAPGLGRRRARTGVDLHEAAHIHHAKGGHG